MEGGQDERSAPSSTDATDTESYFVHRARHLLQKPEEDAYQTKKVCVFELKFTGIRPERLKTALSMNTSK